MKKFWLGMLIFGITTGCDIGIKTGTYYYEAYYITTGHYNSFTGLVSGGLNYTFSQTQGFRQTLRSYNGTFIESNSGTEWELKTFANKHGIGDSEYARAKYSLDSGGNIILFAAYVPLPLSYKVWIYVEKE